MNLERVKVGDVYPSEMNPREALEGIDALAEKLEATGGEPVDPIVVVRDGGIYRLVNGHRRHAAMVKLGTRECNAVVCEDWHDADVLLAMLATDDKQPLTELEKSRGIQQMLLLGVEPQKVAKAAGVPKKTVQRVNRAMIMVGDAAEDMTTDRLVWVAEHDDLPAEDVARVENAPESSWRSEADMVEREARVRKEVERKRWELSQHGVRCLDGTPTFDSGLRFVPESMRCPACRAVVTMSPWSSAPYVSWYCDDAERHGWATAPDAERERQEAEHRAKREADAQDAERRKAMVMQICKQDDMDALLETFAHWFVRWWYGRMPGYDAAALKGLDDEWLLPRFAVDWMEGKLAEGIFDEDKARMYADWVTAVDHATGYVTELSDNEQANLAEAEKLMGGGES